VQSLQQDAGEIQSNAESMSEIASSSTHAIESFQTTLHEFNTVALQTSKEANRIENSTFSTLAKMDHIILKANAYSAIFHGKMEESFEDHHNCRLGRWYERGMGKERFSKLPSYNALLQPHQTIHSAIEANMKFIQNGDFVTDNKDNVIANFQAMEEASDTLFSVIDALLFESGKER